MDSTQEAGTEARILRAAEEVFLRDGYDGARMQVIAETAGINKALLHYYSRSKEKLFEQIMLRLLSQFLPQVTAAFTADMSAHQRMEAFVGAYLNLLRSNPQLPLFILHSLNRHPEFVAYVPRNLYEVIAGFLKQEMGAGNIRRVDPDQFLLSILGMCIFPFVARPMAMHMMHKTEDEYNALLNKRKAEIMLLISTITRV